MTKRHFGRELLFIFGVVALYHSVSVRAFAGTRAFIARRSNIQGSNVPIVTKRRLYENEGTGGEDSSSIEMHLEVDVAIVGAGLGGLCAGAILNTLYNKKVAVFESHYLAGGCAHAFDRKSSNGEVFTFDSGPTILLG